MDPRRISQAAVAAAKGAIGAAGSAPPGTRTIGAIDSLLSRIARSKTEQALLDAYRINSGSPGSYRAMRPLELLTNSAPSDIARIDQFANDYGLDIGSQLGAGFESSVLGTSGQFRGDPTRDRVLKIALRDRMLGGADKGFDLPRDVPGVAAYDAVEDFGPIRAALQTRARTIDNDSRFMMPVRTTNAIRRLKDSLFSRGWGWDDAHYGNIGELDGEWVVIDGQLLRRSLLPGFQTYGGPYPTAEEAIRALRLLPGEEELLNPWRD